MQQFSLCFGKVKRDCLKFIKSQETKADKFKNKERMIKSFLIPLCFWISKKADKKRPYFVGLAGGQGSGKTTISSLIKIILIKYFKLKVFRISIDDFYKTRKERINLSNKIHPMLLTRGVPGTHDINMMLRFFRKAKSRKFKRLKLPKFNKENTPKPSNSEIKVLTIEGGYFAVIKYSGRSSDQNFLKNKDILEKQLKQDNITILSPPIRASYNSPFTLPMLKRNEVMYRIDL